MGFTPGPRGASKSGGRSGGGPGHYLPRGRRIDHSQGGRFSLPRVLPSRQPRSLAPGPLMVSPKTTSVPDGEMSAVDRSSLLQCAPAEFSWPATVRTSLASGTSQRTCGRARRHLSRLSSSAPGHGGATVFEGGSDRSSCCGKPTGAALSSPSGKAGGLWSASPRRGVPGCCLLACSFGAQPSW